MVKIDVSKKNRAAFPKFVPDFEKKSSRIYSNYVAISHTGLDFTLTFLDVMPPTKEQLDFVAKDEEVPVPLQCQVVLPNEVIPSLIGALQEQLKKYENKLKESQ